MQSVAITLIRVLNRIADRAQESDLDFLNSSDVKYRLQSKPGIDYWVWLLKCENGDIF